MTTSSSHAQHRPQQTLERDETVVSMCSVPQGIETESYEAPDGAHHLAIREACCHSQTVSYAVLVEGEGQKAVAATLRVAAANAALMRGIIHMLGDAAVLEVHDDQCRSIDHFRIPCTNALNWWFTSTAVQPIATTCTTCGTALSLPVSSRRLPHVSTTPKCDRRRPRPEMRTPPI